MSSSRQQGFSGLENRYDNFVRIDDIRTDHHVKEAICRPEAFRIHTTICEFGDMKTR